MENNKSLKTVVLILLIVVFGLGGFFLGKRTAETENLLMDQKTPEENKEVETDNTEPEEVVYNIPTNCQKLVAELNFITDNQIMYCSSDKCSIVKEEIDKYHNENKDYNILTFELKNNQITISNSNGTTPLTINNVKAFKTYFSVQSGIILYVLDNNNKLSVDYLKYEDDNNTQITGTRDVYTDVKDFDIFDGHSYEDCVKSYSEGQEIVVALHTNAGKFVIVANETFEY